MISDFTSMAFKNMKKRKLRSFLTLVGIMISIATIFVLISVSLGLSSAIEQQFEKLGSDKFFVQPRGQFGPPGSSSAIQLTQDDVDVIRRIAGVDAATYWTMSNARIEYRDETRFTTVGSIELDEAELGFTTLEIEEGEFLGKGDLGKIVVGSQYKHNEFVGSSVSLRDKIEINDREFQVVGILKQVGNPSDDRIIYMSEENFRELFNITRRIDFIVIQIQEGEDINEVADDARRKLMRARDVDEETVDFTILTPEELLASFGTVLSIITSFLFGIAAISLLVGGINISNTMFTSVLERTKEIGVMKAIGAKNKDILLIFLIESGILGLVGGILGVTFGYAVAKTIEYVAVTQLATNLLQVATPVYLFVGCLGFAFFAGAVSGFWPSWRATKIKPVDALRYE